MYGQKTSAVSLATGISVASWWMWGVTVMLSVAAAILFVKVFISIRSRDKTRRP